MQQVEIRRAQDSADVAEQAAVFILERLLIAKNKFHIALTGGTVGILTLKALSQKEEIQKIDFSSIHFWFGDDRFVAAESPDRNAVQAKQALLGNLEIPSQNIHEMPASDQIADLDEAALSFSREISKHFNFEKPCMDLTILGMGPDGHVASLFPGHTYPESLIVAEHSSPKPPPKRISMSYDLLNASKEILFVVSGIDKAEAVERVHKEPDCDLPAARVAATEKTIWIVDSAAGATFWSC
jgi:6-phosphogluconolactonase